METAFTSEASAVLLKKKESFMQVIENFSDLDYTSMNDGETALLFVSDGKWSRLWKRGHNLQISLPLDEETLTLEETVAIQQIQPAMEGN